MSVCEFQENEKTKKRKIGIRCRNKSNKPLPLCVCVCDIYMLLCVLYDELIDDEGDLIYIVCVCVCFFQLMCSKESKE